MGGIVLPRRDYAPLFFSCPGLYCRFSLYRLAADILQFGEHDGERPPVFGLFGSLPI